MGALTIGFMGNAEQASITNVAWASDSSVVCTIQNTGGSSVTISSATIDGNAATISNSTGTAPWIIAKGASATLTVGFSGSFTFSNTAQYTIKLQTAKGNTLTTSYTYTGQPSA
jgi:hypothetical protein